MYIPRERQGGSTTGRGTQQQAAAYIRDGRPHQKGWVFGKVAKGGRVGNFQSKNLYCRFWTFKQGYLSMKLKNCIMIFRKWGEGAKAVWNFSENSSVHPFLSPLKLWKGNLRFVFTSSLRCPTFGSLDSSVSRCAEWVFQSLSKWRAWPEAKSH